MSVAVLNSPGEVLDRLCTHVERALTDPGPDEDEEALSVCVDDGSRTADTQRSLQVDGPDETVVQVDVHLFPAHADTCDVLAETGDQQFRHLTCDLTGGDADRDDVQRVGRALASFLLQELERKRGEGSPQQTTSSTLPPEAPLLILDENGTIETLTESARRVLEYSPEASVESNFCSHVHARNLPRVMRDLAYIADHRKQQAWWLLRLRTGTRRWGWYRAVAIPRPRDAAGSIQILLRPL